MHDGTVRQADDWLSANLGAYAAWAKTNNSLLIVTWDEDDNNGLNQIPTILYGAALRDGTVLGGTWTLHHLLRTLEDMYGVTTHAGSAAQVRSMIGAFTNDPPSLIVQTFRQGFGGYAGALDTQVRADNPNTSYATSQNLVADLDTTSGTPSHALVRSIPFLDRVPDRYRRMRPFICKAGSLHAERWQFAIDKHLPTPSHGGGLDRHGHVEHTVSGISPDGIKSPCHNVFSDSDP